MKEKEFTLFWLTGKKEIVTGENINVAVNKHYGGGAMKALDFWTEGNYMNSDEYIFDEEKHMWRKKMDKINELKKYLERMIGKCTDMGDMEKEKWAFRQVYKKIEKLESNEED